MTECNENKEIIEINKDNNEKIEKIDVNKENKENNDNNLENKAHNTNNIQNNSKENTHTPNTNSSHKLSDKLEHKISRNKLAYLLISFNQGIGSISELAVSYYFKDVLKLEPASLSQIMSLVSIPWMIKPILGLLTDLVPLCGYRRKYYIVLCGFLNIICWLSMAFYVNSLLSAFTSLLFINLGLSFSTVLGEAVVVELSQLHEGDDEDKSKAKDYVSTFFICKYCGYLVSAYMKGLLVETMSIKSVFFVASLLPWLLVISGLVMVESKVRSGSAPEDNTQNNNNQNEYGTLSHNPNPHNDSSYAQPIPKSEDLIKNFFEFLCQKYVIVPTLFIIAFMATPSYGDPFFYFLTNELKFTPTDLGKISFCATLATLIAICMYKWCFKNVNFKLMITIGTILSFFFSFLALMLVNRVNVALGISDFILVLFSNSFLSMLGEITFMPMLSLACLLCPKNLEGTVYALFMSAMNFGGILSGLFGSFLTTALGITATDYHNLNKLVLISNVLTLVPLPFLCFVSSSYFQPELYKPEDDGKNVIVENLDSKDRSAIKDCTSKNYGSAKDNAKDQDDETRKLKLSES